MKRHELKTEVNRLHKEGRTYEQIGQALNISAGYAWRIGTRPLPPARRRLLDVPPVAPAVEVTRRYGSVALGCITEALAAVKLLESGFDVWRPFIDRHRCDLAVLAGGKLLRIQVKTATYDRKTRRFRCGLGTRKRTSHVRYCDGDFDFFLLKCAAIDAWYVVPSRIGIQAGFANLYPNREKLVDHSSRVDFEPYRDRFDLLQ